MSEQSQTSTPPAEDDHDTIIIGAGLSGICAAWHLTRARPDDKLAVLEARDNMGGTWDLFRYPGIRSDSDMPTLGFTFRPWLGEKAIADGPSIRKYIRDTADEAGITPRIRFGHKLRAADWDSQAERWVLSIDIAGESRVKTMRCRFLLLCSGYYSYEAGYTPDFPGIDQFSGQVIHPQQWPESLDIRGKRIAVIGSGATAVTLIPELAREAAQVTMIQRTPTYIAALPWRDAIANWLHRWFGARVAHWLVRWKNILYSMLIFQISRRRPAIIKKQILDHIEAEIGDRVDVKKHFQPPYNPWDQRLCLAPDGDFFEAIKSGKADIETDTIEGFTSDSVRLASGQSVGADIVVTATGLALEVAGGATISIDGERVEANQLITYKGAMLSGIPNLALTMGYTNASWTLKCELIAQWVVRLLGHMDKHGYTTVVPHYDEAYDVRPFIDLGSGYIARAAADLPRQTTRRPWTVNQNYFLDLKAFRWSRIDDGALRFSAGVRS